jgi:CDGSH-type Zn-finger protein
MAETTIKIMDKGPLFVQGPVELLDAEGNRFETNAQFALCRCGQSHKKPFCDGTHGRVGFDNCARAQKVL